MNRATFFVVDVGQGTATVLVYDDGRAVVIDVGAETEVGNLIRVLERSRVTRIEHIFISHNDKDHYGGLPSVLAEYRGRIGTVWFLDTSRRAPSHYIEEVLRSLAEEEIEQAMKASLLLHQAEEKNVAIWAMVNSASEHDQFKIERIEARTESSLADDIAFVILFPDFKSNRIALGSNEVSALIQLNVQGISILTTGDLEHIGWTNVLGQSLSISSDILVLPHHGGVMRNPSQWAKVIAAISPLEAYVSVGTSNQYEHPRTPTVLPLVQNGCELVCTQLTPRCHDNPSQLAPGVVEQSSPGSSGIPCGGTIIVVIGNGTFRRFRSSEHQAAVTLKVDHPVCLP